MPIEENDLDQARTLWGDGLIEIGNAYDTMGIDEARKVAEEFIDAAYCYNTASVLFKPTLASGAQSFRPTRKGALSYFIGHDDEFPLDTGFALKGWCEVISDSSTHFIENDMALWMGNMIMTDKNGDQTTVNKSFGYKRDHHGGLKIVLHHSSLPYEPK